MEVKIINSKLPEFLDLPKEACLLTRVEQFDIELIRKTNEKYKGVKPMIEEVNFYEPPHTPRVNHLALDFGRINKRWAIINTLYDDKTLQSANLWSITPLQSELLRKNRKLPSSKCYFPCDRHFEFLAEILYDLMGPKEIKVFEDIKNHKDVLGLSEFSDQDLEDKLPCLIVNAGLKERRPCVLPGLTQIYFPKVLRRVGRGYLRFSCGLDHGVPYTKDLGGKRLFGADFDSFYCDTKGNLGLRNLYLENESALNAVGGEAMRGIVTIAHQEENENKRIVYQSE